MKLAVVIPCYKVANQIGDVLAAMPDVVDRVFVVDDACPERTGEVVRALGLDRVEVLVHEQNQGVGGAMITGLKEAMKADFDVVVKLDGDGQMDPTQIEELIDPIRTGRADYCKGNRFRDFKRLGSMPLVRLLGNSALSFLVKVASGYWSIVDPTNGYTAIHVRTLRRLDLDGLARRYFFESDMLCRLALIRAVVEDVPLAARYGGEPSSLSIGKALAEFPPRLILNFFRRILLLYFVYDFNLASLYLLLGLPLVTFGTVLGAIEWAHSIQSGIAAPLGTIILAALPIILGLEMLLQGAGIDISSQPRR